MLYHFKRRAFTLAEVLITLGIIGVVAALTIPNVVINYQKQETVSKLKKAYSVMQNAIKMSETDNGEVSTWTPVSEKSAENTEAFVKKYFVPYLNISKYCGYVSDSSPQNDCYAKVDSGIVTNGSTYGYYMYSNHYFPVAFYLNDGTLIKIGANDGWANVIAFIYINLKPNDKSLLSHFSRNVFVTVLFSDGKYGFFKLHPILNTPYPDIDGGAWHAGSQDFYNYNLNYCKSGVYNSCGAIIEMNNWEIPDNYQW